MNIVNGGWRYLKKVFGHTKKNVSIPKSIIFFYVRDFE